MKKQQIRLKILVIAFALLLFSNAKAQFNARSSGSYDIWVNEPGWSWTIDDANNSPNREGFRWWQHGGDNFGQLLMQLREISQNNIYSKSLEIPTSGQNAMFSLSANDQRATYTTEGIFPFLFLTAGDARSSIFYGKNNFLNFSINPKSPLNSSTYSYSEGFRFLSSEGADITANPGSYGKELMRIQKNGNVGIGTSNPNSALHVRGDFLVQSLFPKYDNTWDNFRIHVSGSDTKLISNGDEEGMFLESKTGNKITIGDGNDTLLFNGHKVVLDCNAVELTQVSLNTNKQVENAALTVAGAAYIGPKAELAADGSLSKFNSKYLSNYNLWVETGVCSEDFAFANVKTWRDDVFKSDYKLMPLEEVKNYIDQNKHLPEVPSEKNIKENGYTAHQMNMILMQKIEELTLYTISLNEEIKKLKEECTTIKNKP